MTRTSGTARAALVGMTTAFLLVSTVIVAACGYRLTAPDFPVLKLTSSTAAAPATATPPRGTE
jgi:hypothetical protein